MASRVADLPPLRDVIGRFGLSARKALGQHYLLDLNLTARVARAAGTLAGKTVIEVGPGPGGLTRALLQEGAGAVMALERDPRFVVALAELAAVADGRLTVAHADALETEVWTLGAPPRLVVANLPYNISTALLVRWLRHAEAFDSMTLMFQKEVADRLAATPGTPAYGRLSVVAQWQTVVQPLFTVPARAFTPPPKVESMVVRLVPRRPAFDVPFDVLERVTAAAFGQRRKMLRSSLKGLGEPEALLAAAGIAPTERAEQVDVPGFLGLARALAQRQVGSSAGAAP